MASYPSSEKDYEVSDVGSCSSSEGGRSVYDLRFLLHSGSGTYEVMQICVSRDSPFLWTLVEVEFLFLSLSVFHNRLLCVALWSRCFEGLG